MQNISFCISPTTFVYFICTRNCLIHFCLITLVTGLCWSILSGFKYQVSPSFYNVSCVFCCRVQRHPFERIATPFQVYSWTAPQVDHAMDCVRAEDAYTSRLGYEEHIPGQVGTAEHRCTSGWWITFFPVLIEGFLCRFVFRPEIGTRSCRPQESCPGRTCLNACWGREPYSRYFR